MVSIASVALSKWDAIKSNQPPAQAELIFQENGCVLYVESTYGPAIPYFGFDHGDGQINHGYKRVKGDLSVISLMALRI